MAKSKKRKPLPPRVKRMKRPARLESAKKWIPTYTGKHLLRGYCNHYAVDWRCAVIELKLLGMRIDPAYIAKRERTEAELTKQRQTRKEGKSLQNLHWHPFTDRAVQKPRHTFEPLLFESKLRLIEEDDATFICQPAGDENR